METNIAFGTEIKTLYDDGDTMRLGAYLVLFGSPDQTDITPLTADGRGRDYFDKDTDFDLIEGKGAAPVLYHHGLNPVLKNRHLALADLTLTDDGVWMETELKARDVYEKRVMQMVRKGKLGLSSGAPRDKTEREVKTNSQGETVHRIVKWPLGIDASLTPTPAEPRTMAREIKSLEEVEEWADELTDVRVEKAEFKSVYLGEWIENDITMAGLSRLADAIMYRVVPNVLSPSDYPMPAPYNGVAQMSVDERKALAKAAFDEFQSIALDLIGRAIDANGSKEAKSLLDTQKSNEASAPELKSFADHRDEALDAIDGFISRASDIKKLRESRTSGAPISASMRESLTTTVSRLVEAKSVAEAILATETAPVSADEEKPAVDPDEAPADPAEADAAWQKFIDNQVRMASETLPATQE